MERPVRSAWAQDAIVEPRLVPSSVLTPDFRRGTGPFFRSELSRQERNFRLQRRLVKIGCGDAITIRRDGISRTTTSNVPARTPFFRWGVVSAVWKDCMVVCAVGCEPVSLLFGQKQGSFRRKHGEDDRTIAPASENRALLTFLLKAITGRNRDSIGS
jgi:hypothetical protein